MKIFFQNLLKWYTENGRKLPWRETKDPYKIWISEIMLQQTRVLQACEYFLTFLRYFPDVNTLAHSDERSVLKQWQGLGYYSRALNIHSTAKIIAKKYKGRYPSDYNSIRALKGIGEYTAAAVSSIAFNLPYPAVDGNVKRVAARFFGIKNSIMDGATVRLITELLSEIIMEFPPGDFNQAMIELGALVCIPGKPKCGECPLREACVAYKEGLQTVLPIKPPKRKPQDRYVDYLFMQDGNSTWLLQRDRKSIWKGLYEFPNTQYTSKPILNDPIEIFGDFFDESTLVKCLDVFEAKHQLTHQTIFARFWHLSGKPSNIVRQNKEYLKIPINDLNQFPVHRLMHKYLVFKEFSE